MSKLLSREELEQKVFDTGHSHSTQEIKQAEQAILDHDAEQRRRIEELEGKDSDSPDEWTPVSKDYEMKSFVKKEPTDV